MAVVVLTASHRHVASPLHDSRLHDHRTALKSTLRYLDNWIVEYNMSRSCGLVGQHVIYIDLQTTTSRSIWSLIFT